MKSAATFHRFGLLLALLVWPGSSVQALAQTDPLPSWNEGQAKKAIIQFVPATTDWASPKPADVPEGRMMRAWLDDRTGVRRQSPPMTLSTRSSRE
jgi:hypothetical protein